MRNKCRNKCNKMPASDFIQQMNLWMKNLVFSLSKILIMRLDFFHYLKKINVITKKENYSPSQL